MEFVEEQLEVLKLRPRNVLEIGSYNVNGTLRDLFPEQEDYLGIDIRPGPGVDEISKVDNMSGDSYDLILCSEMLEHDKFPYHTLAHIYRVLHRNGYLILTTRAFNENGCYPMHEVPDYHRFTVGGLHWWFADIGYETIVLKGDPYMPGVFAVCRKP